MLSKQSWCCVHMPISLKIIYTCSKGMEGRKIQKFYFILKFYASVKNLKFFFLTQKTLLMGLGVPKFLVSSEHLKGVSLYLYLEGNVTEQCPLLSGSSQGLRIWEYTHSKANFNLP